MLKLRANMKTIALAMVLTVALETAAPAAGSSAALAIDKRDGSRYGWAINYESASSARARALEECGRLGGKCQVVLEFSGGCGAYAVERGNGSLYGWGTAENRGEAESRALEEARKRGGKDVLIRVWGCNDGKLQTASPSSPSDGGVYFIYAMRMTVKGSDEKVCFVSNPFYVPGVAAKSGDEWAFTSAAPGRLAPYVAKFDSAIKRKYSNASAELEGGWHGGNEITTLSPKMPNVERSKRQKMMADGAAAIKADCSNRGYQIYPVAL